jgi:hypothetical protein
VHTLERIVSVAGFTLALSPKITFRKVPGYRGAPITVPDRLPSNPGLSKVKLPTRVFWSGRRDLDLTQRADRKIAYEAVMSEGGEHDILTFIDRDMLLEIFDEMNMSPAVRAAWEPTICYERSQQETLSE